MGLTTGITLLLLTHLLGPRDSAPVWNLYLHLAPSVLPLVGPGLIARVVDLGLEAEL